MSTQATVIGAYDSVRRSRDAQDQRSRSADGEGDNLMKGRTFIPRMSAESRKLLIEAMQRARKKRQERLAGKKEVGEIGSGLPKRDLTPSQQSRVDDALNASLIREGIDPIPSGQAEQKYREEIVTPVDTNHQDIGEEDLEGIPVGSVKFGGKIPKYKKRTIKYRR